MHAGRIGSSFDDSPLSLSTTRLSVGQHANDATTGDVIDEDELHWEFCKKLISRHTKPGNVVLDLCSGSEAMALAAFESGRSCIAVEVDGRKSLSIASQVRAATSDY